VSDSSRRPRHRYTKVGDPLRGFSHAIKNPRSEQLGLVWPRQALETKSRIDCLCVGERDGDSRRSIGQAGSPVRRNQGCSGAHVAYRKAPTVDGAVPLCPQRSPFCPARFAARRT
jgi:hypothetical protein